MAKVCNNCVISVIDVFYEGFSKKLIIVQIWWIIYQIYTQNVCMYMLNTEVSSRYSKSNPS